jgi:inorganic pyrophosphatase
MNKSNCWHSVSTGDNIPEVVNGIIEISKGSKAKYEIDKESGLLKLDRVLASAVHYPANYGFIPQTYCDDKDPLDILILCSENIQPLCLVEAKVIGAMIMIDNDEMDDKIIAVAKNDKTLNYLNDLSELPEYILKEIKMFFEDYKKLEKKKVEVKEFVNNKKAFEIILESIKLYNSEIRPNL